MWREFRREWCLDHWEHLNAPTGEQMVAVCLCIMRLREEPRDMAIAIQVPGMDVETWVVDVPDSDPLVCILYTVFEDLHAIEYLMIEGID